MDIYWIADKKQCGPATVPDVISLVQMGELTPETRGWHAGCDKWMPLRELPALADFLAERPDNKDEATQPELPPVPESDSAPSAEPVVGELPPGAVRVYLPTPAVRLMARLVDISLYMALFYGVVYVRQIPFDVSLMPSSPMVWLGYVVLESLLVYFLGATPGKSLMGIQLRSVGQGNLSIGRAMSRTCLVFVCGMGMMISILPLIMMGFSWWSLRKRGITAWDARCSTLPLQMQPTRVGRQLLAVLVILVGFHLAGYCIQPWAPDMVSAVEAHDPEAAEWMRRVMQLAPESQQK